MSDYSGMDFSSDAVMEGFDSGTGDSGESLDTSTPDLGTEVTTAPEGVSETAEVEAPVGEAVEVTPGIFEIDGVEVTLDEAKASYLRQADYTRKTQELAEQRKELQQAASIQAALQADPQATLAALAEVYGLDLQAAPSNPNEGLDPEQIALKQLEQRVARFEEAERQERITAEVNALTVKYGEVDIDSVFQHAITGDFKSLESAYRDMTYDTVLANRAAAEKAAADEAARLEAKRAASVVSDTTGSASGSTSEPPSTHATFKDAFLAAKRSLNIS